MANFLLIGLCILAGMLFRNSKTLPADAHKGINAFIIYLAMPAVSFKYLPHIQWSGALILPVAMPLIIWIGSWIFVQILAKFQPLDQATKGTLQLVAGLSNTGFVGFPLISAYFGDKEIGTAIICDQVTFSLLSTAGIILAIRSSDKHQLSFRLIVQKVATFPPLLGCLLALTLPRFINIAPLYPLFDKLAATVAPLALFSIGLQLQFAGWRNEINKVSYALLYKLVIAPMILVAIVVTLHLKGMVPQISIFEAAMPTQLSCGIVISEYQLRPKLGNLVIGIGIVISFVTTAVWWLLLQQWQL